MRWASAVSTAPSLAAAVHEAGGRVRAELGGAAPDLALVFVSPHHAGAYARLPELLAPVLAPRVLVGCSAGGVIGGGREVERRSALSVTAAVLPGVALTPFRVPPEALPGAGVRPAAWADLVGVDPARRPHLLLLPDPFSVDVEGSLAALDAAFPAGSKIGGLASGGDAPGANALYLDAQVAGAGLVGLALDGDVEIDTVVAQGCRPIGEPMFVTRVEGNVIRELDGRRPRAVLQDLLERADAHDRALFRHSLFLGLVMRERQREYRQGDFLIRNLIGLDAATGALAVAALVPPQAVVQLHLRDARTSAEDLEAMLGHRAGAPAPAGALLFSCLGRGMHLYGRADHDTGAFRRHLGEVALGGFFCNGEIGPVEGTTFVHGYTSAFALFRPQRRH